MIKIPKINKLNLSFEIILLEKKKGLNDLFLSYIVNNRCKRNKEIIVLQKLIVNELLFE